MKKFSFVDLDRKLNTKKRLTVESGESQQNFMRFYDELPTDPRIEEFVTSVKNQFAMKSKNHRHYSYDLKVEDEMIGEADRLRVQSIKKLQNFCRSPNRPPEVPDHLETEDPQVKQRKKILRKKFQKNVMIVAERLKTLKMTAADALELGIFDKSPYRFGASILTATKQGDIKKVHQAVAENRLAVFSLDNTRKNALMWACIRGYDELVEFLLQAGSDLNAQDLTGRNALHYAVKYSNPSCIKKLLLRLNTIDDRHQEVVASASQQARNVFNLGIKLMNSMKNANIDKRSQLFEEQYKYLYG